MTWWRPVSDTGTRSARLSTASTSSSCPRSGPWRPREPSPNGSCDRACSASRSRSTCSAGRPLRCPAEPRRTGFPHTSRLSPPLARMRSFSARASRWKPRSNAVKVPRLLGGRLSFALATLFARAVVVVAGTTRSVGAAPTCDPFTPPVFRGEVPTGNDVLGFDLGSQEVTSAESDEYVAAVDAASPRVESGVCEHSAEGGPLTYACVGKPENVSPSELAAVQANARTLRDPATPAGTASAL